MAEPSITKVAGEELPASELNQLIIEALNDYRDFTLGENISANLPVYLKASDSKIYKTSSAADDEKIHSFVGILKEAGSTNDVKKVQVSGKVIGLSGLTAGQKVYLQDTVGNYGTIGTYEKQIGIAISTTSIILRVQMDGVVTKNNQTINGVKTFGSIPELPASDPTTDNQAVRKKYVNDQDNLRSKKLGAWGSSGYTDMGGGIYRADEDLFCIVYGHFTAGGSGGCQLEIRTDGSNPPTTVRAATNTMQSASDPGAYTSCMCPVKKNDYFKPVYGGSYHSFGFYVIALNG